ncbi:hypothetical protein SAMN05443574_101514 [Haloarcula vallismortis]|uniref:Uncharacterized protein n=2 Tax=Haloarcula vallismortis TaxID=28442 RepID=M0IWI8_HALVA|nr:hypothetical protein [Haloarcula vallismortis]EMA01081.1 hypothetical protein C437_19842 [Haloarcula vallismortis ATCC 29715]SDW14746.1 hypothetical protein SAMN05443574_101514 [Haloarcula vallismortis]
MTELDSRPAASSAALAGTVAVLVSLVLALAVVDPIAVLAGFVGGLCIAAGVWALRSDAHERIACGSVAIVIGAGVFCGTALLTTDYWSLVAALGFPLAATLVVIDASSGLVPPTDETDELTAMLDESFVVLVVGICVTIVCAVAAAVRLPWVLVRVVTGFSVHPLVGFVTLQVGVLLALLLLDRATETLESWIPTATATTDRALGRLHLLGTDWLDIGPYLKAAVALQLLVAFVPTTQGLFDRFLDSLPVLGPALRNAFGGPLHLPLAVGLLAVLSILILEQLRQWLLQWLGDDPGRSLARQTGSTVLTVGLLLGALVLTAAGVTRRVAPTYAGGGHYGSATVLLLVVLISVVVLRGLVTLLAELVASELLSRQVAGFAAGSGLLFIMTLLGAEHGLAPILVLVGSAAALLVWDAGVHASSIGQQLGRDADTTDSEFVHVTGTAAILAGAILLVLLVRYVLIPVAVPTTSTGLSLSSVVALGLVLLAIVAFTLALNAHDGGPRTSRDRSDERGEQTADNSD